MSDTTKEKIISVNTAGATKNVKSLKTQIRELKEELAGLEKGTAEYDAVAKKLADTNQRQIEVNEAMKYSNQDIGATFSNLTRVTAGVIGAIQGVNVVMQAFGASEEDAAKATQTLQQTMALIQSLSAIDTARKALHGLTVAFGDLGKAENVAATESMAAAENHLNTQIEETSAALGVESGQIDKNTASKAANVAATNKGTTATVGMAGGFSKLAKALNMSKLALGGWIAVITAAVTAIVILIKRHKELEEEQRLAFAEATRWSVNAGQSVAEVIGKYDLLKKSYTDAKAAGENMTKWTKEHTSALKELNMENTTQNQLEDIFINKTDEFVTALTKRYVAEWKLKAAQDEYISNLKQIKIYQDSFDPNTWLSLQQKITLDVNGEKITKTYEEWRKDAQDAQARNEKLMSQLGGLTKEFTDAGDELKKFGINFNNTVKTTGMTVKQLIEEFKKLYKEILNESLNWRNYKSIFNGFYNEADQMLDKIKHLIKINGFEINKVLSKQFLDELELENGELTRLSKFDITLDFIFDKDALKKLEDELAAEEETLRKYSEGEEKVTNAQLEEQKKTVNGIKLKIAAYNELAETVVKYLALVEAERDKYGETATKKKAAALEKERQIYLTYTTDIRSRNPWAELNHTLDQTESELEDVKTELAEINAEEADLMKKGLYNKESIERYREIAEKREELQKKASDLERTLEENNYQIRLKHINDKYEEEKKKAEKLNQELENSRNAKGGGVVDYNTDVDILTNEYNAIISQMGNVESYFDTEIENAKKKYQELLSTVVEGSDDFLKIERERDEQLTLLEIEKQAALTELEQDGADKRAQIAQAEFERKAKIQKAYVNSLTAITGQISNLIGEQMNAYDQDSKKYKDLQIAQATINTISGMLSAFVSGFQSGIPWPGNLILAGVLSGLVYATGRQSIENIKNESLRNNTSDAATGNFGDYDTLSYMNSVDLIDTIQDQRVYVTENDITTTQNRVQVRESEATF